jgi:ribonuclease HII
MDDLVIGVDENGLGCIAGPVVVTAVAARVSDLPRFTARDSKSFGKNLRRLTQVVQSDAPYAVAVRTVMVPADRLTAFGYTRALSLAFLSAVSHVRRRTLPRYPLAVIDGLEARGVPYCRCEPKADANHPQVAYASCVGKVRQIREMALAEARWPGYGFSTHNGYCAPQHVEAIRRLGAIPGWHRMAVVAGLFTRKGWPLHVRSDT